MTGANHLPGTETPCIRFATEGNSTLDTFRVPFQHRSFISSEINHQNRANTAGSYYKGTPGPEDQAPQSLSMGNRGSILYSKLYAGTHMLLEGGEKSQTSQFCAPVDFQSQVYSKGNLILMVTNGRVTKAEPFHDTPPSPQTRQKVAHHHPARLAHEYQGTPGFYPGTAQGVNTDDKDPLLEWLPFRTRGFYSSLGQTLIQFNPWATRRMAWTAHQCTGGYLRDKLQWPCTP